MAKLLINLTCGPESPDKTTVAFVVANAGVAAGQEVVIFLSVEGVRLGVTGGADTVAVTGFKPLKELVETYTTNGGKLWVCPPCFNARALNQAHLLPGASLAGGAPVVEFLSQGAASLSY